MKKVALMIAIMAIGVGSIAQVTIFPVKKDGIVRVDTTQEAAMGFKIPDTVLILKDTIITTNGITKRMITKRIYRAGNVTDSSLKVAVFGGILAGIQNRTGVTKDTGFVAIRVGGSIDYRIGWLNFNVAAVRQVQTNQLPWDWQSYSITLNPWKGFTAVIGDMATLPTQQRPYPGSGPGFFETYTEFQAPGGERGAKITYQFNNGLEIGAGTALRNDQLEYAGRVAYRSFQFSGWYAQWSREMGGILTFSKGRIYSVLVYKQNEEIPGIQKKVASSFINVVVSKKHNIQVYNDLGFMLSNDHPLDRGETGVLKCFSSKYLNGLIGLGWDYKNKWVVPYLFITL